MYTLRILQYAFKWSKRTFSVLFNDVGNQCVDHLLSAQLEWVALFRKVPESILTLYDFFENKEQQISGFIIREEYW